MEPQITADERRFVDWNYQQNSTRMTRIKRIFTDPCESASSAQSVFYRTDSRTKSTGGKVSALFEGRLIVDDEQHGEARAEYGKETLMAFFKNRQTLSAKLSWSHYADRTQFTYTGYEWNGRI